MTINTQRWSSEEVELLRNVLLRFGVVAEIMKCSHTNRDIIRIGADATEVMSSLIAPYVPPVMKYKVTSPFREVPCVLEQYPSARFDALVESYVLDVIDHVPSSKMRNVFDLTIADNPNYFAKGVLIHNSSLSIGYSPINRPDDPLAVCSRNYELKDMPSAYWDIVHELNLDEKLKKYCDDNRRELLVQGELVGPGIQNNRDHLEKRNLQVFRIWDIKAQAFVQPEERYEICRALGVDHVPVLTRTTLAPYVDPANPDYMQAVRDNILKSADGTTANGNLREGIVFKQADGKGGFHFKAVSNKYLEGLK